LIRLSANRTLRHASLAALVTIWIGVSACEDPVEGLSEHSDFKLGGDRAVQPLSPLQAKGLGSEDVLATVGQVAITGEDVIHHYRQHDGALPLEDILEKLIEFEVLALEAQKRGFQGDKEVSEIAKKGAVREFLHTEMVENHGEKDIRDDDFEFWYRRAYQRFVHEDGYFGTDAQFVCCFESDLEKCESDPEVETCFQAQEPVMEWVHQALDEGGPYPNKEAFQDAVTTLAGEVQSAKPLAQINVNFWYKEGIPYEEQTGYTKLNVNLVEAIVKTPVGEFTKPIRSNHGWHVTYLFEFLPTKNLKSTDPEARKEIAAHVYPLVQKRDFAFLVKKLETEKKPFRDDALLLKLLADTP
jgi:hypothetical protein